MKRESRDRLSLVKQKLIGGFLSPLFGKYKEFLFSRRRVKLRCETSGVGSEAGEFSLSLLESS